MHWSEKIARDIIRKRPLKETYVCAAGISPSGSVHIGNFRDVATAYFVAKSIKKLGHKVKFLFSWDEYDRFRKVPKNVEAIAPDFYKNIGLPYSDIVDPYGTHGSYAEHFEKQFEASLKQFGIEVEFIYQAREYKSGRYSDDIVYTLTKRKEIYDIIMQFKTQEANAEERENYYPVSIYCASCGKDDTTIHAINDDCTIADYSCKCGFKGKINFKADFHCKLVWKLDWPMRWRAEEVDFEPGGKDHAAVGGSYQVCKVISSEIYGYNPPIFQGYEFIGIKGSAGKMSGSTGLNIVPDTLLKIYQPEVILWLYSKTEPTKAFDFCFDEEILRQYHEFDKSLTQVNEGNADEYTQDIMYYTSVNDRKLSLVPMAQLVNFGSIVNWNENMLEVVFLKIGQPYTKEQFKDRLVLARYWLEYCSPESIISLNDAPDREKYDILNDNEKQMIKILYEGIRDNDYSIDDMNTFLYAVPTMVYPEMDIKQKKKVQGRFFEIVYNLLIGRNNGPRLYLFLMAVEKSAYLHLLSF